MSALVMPRASAQAAALAGSAPRFVCSLRASQLGWSPASANRPAVSPENSPVAPTGGVTPAWSWPTGPMKGLAPAEDVGSSCTWEDAPTLARSVVLRAAPAHHAPPPMRTTSVPTASVTLARVETAGFPVGPVGAYCSCAAYCSAGAYWSGAAYGPCPCAAYCPGAA